MIVYIICFISSIGCTYIAQKKFEIKRKKEGIFFSILAILIPSILAGIRATTVGSDTAGYVERSFYQALNSTSLSSFIEKSELEVGYNVFTYIIAKIFRDIHWILFIIQLIVCSIVYKMAYDRRNQISMPMLMLVYFTVFYSMSLNIARQAIAIAIILYTIKLMEDKKYIKTVLLFWLAFQFHTSAIFALFLYIIIYINQKKINRKSKIMITFFMIVFLIMIVISYEQILYYMTFDLEIIPHKFYNYLNSDYVNEAIDISLIEVAFKGIWIFLSVLYIIINKKNKEYKIDSYIMFLIIDLCMFFISAKVSNAFRMGYYYGMTAMMLTIPALTSVFKQDKTNKTISTILIGAILIAYWFYCNILYRGAGIYPYVSDIIPILNYLL